MIERHSHGDMRVSFCYGVACSIYLHFRKLLYKIVSIGTFLYYMFFVHFYTDKKYKNKKKK